MAGQAWRAGCDPKVKPFALISRLLHGAYVEVFRRYPALIWIAGVAVFGQIAVASINSFALSFYVLDTLKQPGRVLGYLASSFLLTETVLKLPFGHWSDLYGRRRFVVIGVLAVVVTPSVVILVPARTFLLAPVLIWLVLLPARLIGGAGSAAVWPPLYAAVPDSVPPRDRGTGMAVVNSAYIAGLALGPALAGLTTNVLIRPLRHEAPFALAAVCAAVAAVIGLMLPAQAMRREQKPQPGESERMPGAGVIAVIVAITMAEMFATSTLAPYLAPFVHLATGMSLRESGLFLLLIGVPAGVLGVPIGRLVDRLPKRSVRQISLWVTAVAMTAVCLSYSAIALALWGIAVVIGFLFGLPAWMALIANLAPRGKSGRMMGIFATAEGVGSIAGPIAGGYLWDINIRDPFWAAAAMLAIGAIIATIFMGSRWENTSPVEE